MMNLGCLAVVAAIALTVPAMGSASENASENALQRASQREWQRAWGDEPRPTALPDPRIAHIVYTVGVLDIREAKLAQKKTHNDKVRAFADEIVRDDTEFNDQLLALLKKLHITPEDNDTSKRLKKQADETHKNLSKLNGAAFDKAYAANERYYDDELWRQFTQVLTGRTRNPELKEFLTSPSEKSLYHSAHAHTLNYEVNFKDLKE